MNIVLSGMPGSGKTTVSLILGKMLNAEVLDTDAVITAKHGEISKIFETHGEEYFRELESLAVEEVCAKKGAIISTGGGCLLKERNRNNLKKSGKIVFLRTSLNELLKRTAGDTSRPLLQGEKRQRLEKLLTERTPVYEECADITLDTDGLTPEQVAIKITELLK